MQAPIRWTLVALVAACNTAVLDPEPRERFGQIQVRVRDMLWLGDFGPDSVIGRYDPISGQLALYAGTGDRYAGSRSVNVVVCTIPGRNAYAFARLNRGPYGVDRLALGAWGAWYEPITLNPKPPHLGTAWTLISTGLPGDSIVFEALFPWYARGSFRFRAATYGGEGNAFLTGRFFGRLERLSGRCPLTSAGAAAATRDPRR